MAAGKRPKKSQASTPINPFNEMFDQTYRKYPGKGMYRGPVLGAVPEFNFDAAVDEIGDAIWKELQGLGVADNVKKLMWDDIMNSMVVSISPKSQSYNLQGQPELRGDEAEIAGFNPSIDINPIKWIMDPEKMAKKTAENWVKSFWNTADMSAAVETGFYNRLLEGDKYVSDKTLQEPYYNYLLDKTKARENYDVDGRAPGTKHGFQLAGFDVVRKADYKSFDKNGQLVFIDNAANEQIPGNIKDKYINEGYYYYKEGDKSPNNKWVTKDEHDQMVAAGTKPAAFTAATTSTFAYPKKEVNVVTETKDKFRNFVRFSKAEGTRRSNYTEYGITTVESISKEMDKFRESRFKELENVTTQLKTATGVDAINLRNQQSKLLNDISQADNFLAEAKVIGTLKNIQGRTGNSGLKGVSTKLNQVRLGVREPPAVNDGLAEFFIDDAISTDKQTKYAKRLKEDANTLKAKSKLTEAEIALAEAENMVMNGLTFDPTTGKWIRTAGTGNSKEWNRINARTEPFRQKLKELRKVGTALENDLVYRDANGNILVKATDTVSKTTASMYKGRIDDQKNLLSQNGMFSGYGDMLVEQTIENVLDRDSDTNKLITQNPEHFAASTNMINVMREGKRIYVRESTRDFLTKLEKKGVVGVLAEYGWKRFRTLLNGYAPAAYVQQWLESRQYFGLTYNPDYDYGGSMSALANPTIRKIMDSKWFDNNVSINLQQIGILGEAGASTVLKFQGHRRFGMAIELFKKLGLEEGGDYGTNNLIANDPNRGGFGFKSLLESKKLDIDPTTGKAKAGIGSLSPADFFKLLNGDLDNLSPEALDIALLSSLRMPAGADGESITAASRKRALKALADNLRKWLFEHRKELGLENAFNANGILINTPENFSKLFKLFGKMFMMENNNDLISILSSKAGIIQKLVSYLSKVQTTIFRAMGLLMAPYAYLKNSLSKWLSKQFLETRWGKQSTEYVTSKLLQNKAFNTMYKAVTEKISYVLSKVFGFILTDVSMGVGLVAQWLVERVVQTIINKTVDAFKAGLDRFKKYLEFDGIDLFIEDAVTTWMKVLKSYMACCAVAVTIPMMLVAALILMITPVDPTKSKSGIGYGTAPPGGPSQSCIPCCGPNTETCPENTPTCSGAPGECEIVKSAGCFSFTDKSTWPSGGTEYEIVWDAAQHLLSNHGCYVDKVCAAGTITVQWSGSVCGWTSGNTISFGNHNCWTYVKTKQDLFNNLFAHETGHVYDGMNADAVACVQNAADNEGFMRTYPVSKGNCSATNINEDFAETIAQFVWARPPCGYPNTACSGGACPQHVSCAEDIFSCN